MSKKRDITRGIPDTVGKARRRAGKLETSSASSRGSPCAQRSDQSKWGVATKTDVLSPSDTAYPLLKASPTGRELQELS